MPAQVDAREVDFSDRVNGKRKSYRTSSRRQRVLEDGTEQIGDLSDEEHDESLERKIARLRREIEEAKEEYGRQKAQAPDQTATAQEPDFATLSKALDEISVVPKGSSTIRPSPAPAAPAAPKEHGGLPDTVDNATYTVTYAPDYEQSHALAKTADFDRRLDQLEKAIGVTAANMPGLDGDRLPRAVVPTLDALQRQLTVLSEASTSSLDSISRRVRELTKDAEELEKSRKAAKSAQESLEVAGIQSTEPSDEQTAKINALYGTLPAIESLAPLLPTLLDRLRSLRAIHADAATASETLERIEKSQAEMATDIKQWREGLEKIEGAMKEGDESMNANKKVIEGWVQDLEAKVAKLA
jgi:nuclear migration protein JNM1